MNYLKHIKINVFALSIMFCGIAHSEGIPLGKTTTPDQDKNINNIALDAKDIYEQAQRKRASFELLLKSKELPKNEIQSIELDNAKVLKWNELTEDITPDNSQIFVFLSKSLSETELKNTFVEVSGYQNASIVFRGVPKGKSLGKGMLEIQKLLDPNSITEIPSIIIDPTLYKKYNVNVVPTIVIVHQNKVALKVTGLSNINTIYEKMSNGDLGDIGKYGPVTSILEPDLIEVAKEKAKNINWDEEKSRSITSFWSRVNHAKLPHATENNFFEVDPTIEIYGDIITDDGQYVARKGDRINPLDKLPFTQEIVIFDGTSTKQIEFIKQLLDEGKLPNPILMISNFEKAQNWESFNKLQEKLGKEVYLLKPEITSRFLIRNTPSVVKANNQKKVFEVTEVSLQ